jgi:hypothetical protein
MASDVVTLEGEAREVALAETQAVLALVQQQDRRVQLADLIAKIVDGEISPSDAEALEEILELALTSGRIRALYGPSGETAALATFRRLPRGTELAKATRDVNVALEALQGKSIRRLGVTSVGAGAYQLVIAAGETELTLRLDRQAPRISSVTM